MIAQFAPYLAEWLGVVAVVWLFSISPNLRQPRLGFKYARRDGLVALSLYLLITVLSFALYSGQVGGRFLDSLSVPDLVQPLLRPLVLAVVCLLPFVIALIIRGQPIRSIGWGPATLRPALYIGILLVLLTIFLRNRVMDVLGGPSSDQITYLLYALGLALAEETVFRGYIQPRLSWWMGDIRGWIAASVMFAVWRFPALLGTDDLPSLLIGLGILIIQGLLAGWIMRRANHAAASALYRAASIWMNIFI
jgi:membrane protease YdiL (CAAX protease family)